MNWEILYKYIDGSCSKEELDWLSEWLRDDPANEDFFKTFIESKADEHTSEHDFDARKAYLKYQQNHVKPAQLLQYSGEYKRQKTEGKRRLQPKSKRSKIIYWYYAAAAIILISTTFIITKSLNTKTQNGKQLASREIITSNGQRKTFKLSDGTSVILNADSKMIISPKYGVSSRIIHLEGEAFFKVKHDQNHPFMVITNRTFVKDLGTQFNVMAYDSTKVIVAVKEGMVSMGQIKHGNLQKAMGKLTHNKLGVLNQSGKFEVSGIRDLNNYMGWTEGKLVFNQTRFPVVLKRLDRWYNINCIIGDPKLQNRTLTATYDNMSLQQVLKILSLSLHVSYSHKNGVFIFQDEK